MRKAIMKSGFWILAAIYLLRHARLLSDDQLYLFHDNLGYHFPSFVNFANSLAHGFGFPRLLLEWGGSETAMTAVSMSYFAPHRILGYLLYALLPIKPLLAYKITLLLGFVLNAYGWFLLWKKTLPREELALVAVFFLFCSGIGLTILHHEQMLATISWLPWCLLFASYAFQDGRGGALAGACAGGLMTLHYPQIHIVALLALGLSFLAVRYFRKQPLWGRIGRLTVLEAALCFMLAVAPTLYIFSKMPQYGSPVRKTENFAVDSLAEYLEVNKQQLSSGTKEYLYNFANPRVDKSDDQMAFYFTQIGFWLAVAGMIAILAMYQAWLFLIPVLGISALATLGINSHFAQLLYVLHFPGIAQFRQWYHFSPYCILTLITMAALGAGSLLHLARHQRRAFVYGVSAVVACFSLIASYRYYSEYVTRYHLKEPTVLKRFTADEYLERLNGKWLHGVLPIPYSITLVARKENLRFFTACPDAVKARAWSISKQAEGEDVSTSCETLNAAPQISYPQITFTPTGVKLRSESEVAVALNAELLSQSPVGSLATGAISILKGNIDVPYNGGTFYIMLLVQLSAVLYGIARFVRRQSPSRETA